MEQTDVRFSIEKIYIKDISFETCSSPEIFKVPWKPVVDMHVTNEASLLGDELYEVILSVTVTTKVKDQTAYLVEVNQAGVFCIKNIDEDIISRVLATACANILFPFSREVIADVVTRGGFPQLLLAPVNFEALYEQQKTATVMSKSAVTH